MSNERTLSIIKPDAVAKNVIGEIYSRFEKAGPEHCGCQDDAPDPGAGGRLLRRAQRTPVLSTIWLRS